MLRAMVRSARLAYVSAKRAIENVFFERPAGIDTSGQVNLQDLGLAALNREDYYPSPWFALRRVLAMDDVADHDVFIDFGCGKGRALFQAAKYPFRKVIGVEISPDLAKIAKSNMERSLPKLRCRDIEIVNDDVLNYRVPDDVTFVYFFDPFHGEIFSAVLEKLHESLRRRPRELTIIYAEPYEEAALLKAGARLVEVRRGFRPTRRWAKEKSIRKYTLGAPAPDSMSRGAG